MMKSTPFGRALAIAAMITTAMQSANPQIALRSIPAYTSRGKGKGLHQASRRTVAQDRRAAIKAKNKRRQK